MMKLTSTHFTSPLGDVTAALDGDCVVAFTFTDHWPRVARSLARHGASVEPSRGEGAGLQRRLDAYFAGELAALDGIEVSPLGTEFQRAVWSELRRLRPGETVSYGELARRVGKPAAVRAVGAANGANPIWLIVPCHRAIGADGSLTGYAGGLERKRWLLTHERALEPGQLELDPRMNSERNPRMNTEPSPPQPR